MPAAQQLRAGDVPLGDPPGAVAGARADRRGHGQAQDRDRELAPRSWPSASATWTRSPAAPGGPSSRPAAWRFEVRTAAPSDFITSAGHRGGYILSARDLITNDIEVAVEGALLDGMLCLASCDKTAPGQLMAAARLNIPTIIVACGYQPSGTYRGRHCDIEDVFLAAGHVANGKLTVGRTDRDERERHARPRRVRGHGHGQHDAPGLRGARHGAAGHAPRSGPTASRCGGRSSRPRAAWSR